MPTKAHLFKNSPYFDKDKLTIALFATKYQEADIDWYHEQADIWSNKGKGNTKIDWLATLKKWMLADQRAGKFANKTAAVMDKEVEETAERITNALTSWQKDEQTPPTASPQHQQATQLEIPQDWSEHWEDLQDKARKGISPIIVTPIYYWLCQTGRLVLTIEEKKELFKRAKEHYILQLTAYATPQERHILRKITQPGWEKDLELLESVRTKAKILSVKDYLYESIKPVKA